MDRLDLAGAYILVVEDDRSMREMICFVLSEAGFQTEPASDGETAIELITRAVAEGHLYDVIVSDIVMGSTSGLTVTRVARDQEHPPEVILLTGYGNLETAVEAINVGAFGYLIKPIKWPSLVERVIAAIERRREQEYQRQQAEAWRRMAGIIAEAQTSLLIPTALSDSQTAQPATAATNSTGHTDDSEEYIAVGELQLHMQRREVMLDGERVYLTPIEHAILMCLIRSPGQVISYQMVVQYTHGTQTDERDAYELLRTHVRNLRRKLKRHAIISVRGIGYMLDPALIN